MSKESVAIHELDSPGVKTLKEVVGIPKIGKDIGSWARVFSDEQIHPFDLIKWKKFDAIIKDIQGQIKFEQLDVEFPEWWTQTNVNIVASKYFRNIDGVKETSLKQIILRVTSVLANWADEQNYFNTPEDKKIYELELIHALVHQYGCFNSPVWFNLGVPGRKQTASACFIQGVDDSLDSIQNFQRSELDIFASGSGSGANFSKLRSSYEKLSSGAYVSGPLAWMRGLDQNAGAMKSGGSTRQAAKMVVLDMDHPDILETMDGRPGFIRCKAVEEQRAHDLIKVGYSASYDDPNSAYKNVMYQNANHSVSIPDAFMQAVRHDEEWVTKTRLTDETVTSYRARDLWNEIAKAAWMCGDPGVQFNDLMNKWHTTPKSGKIRASNPCFHPDTRISTEKGLIRIEDLYLENENDEFNIVVQQDKPEIRKATVFPTDVKKVIEIHTRRGRVLKVTPDHKIKTTEGWVEAQDLNEDSVLCLQTGVGYFYNSQSEIDLTWYKIAGWLVGDGWLLRNSYETGLLFGKDDKDVLEKVIDFLTKNDINHSIKRQAGSIGESPDYVRIHRKHIWEYMSRLACDPGSHADDKVVLDSIFRSSRIEQLAYISGLFSADGTFNIQPKKNIDARINSSSLELLRGVQLLLNNLGINSTIYKDRNPNRKAKFSYVTKSGIVKTYESKTKSHDLIITGESLRTFKKLMLEVGLFSDRKQLQFNDIPNEINNYGHDRWTDEIISIIDNNEIVQVFDIIEPDTHSLISNGIVTHNCGEFNHQDNTACNLCALNLTKFFNKRVFNYEAFEHSVRIFVTAQNAIIAKTEYPTTIITKNSLELRPIGLNYGDLGSLIMRQGYSYDSNEGRAIAARLASLMTGYAYLISTKLAARVGAFSEFEKNKDDMIRVMRMHKEADQKILSRWELVSDPVKIEETEIINRTQHIWNQVIEYGEKYGYTNSQVTLMAPLGTISFLMGMDTTGIEPAFSLVSYKTLVGGGMEKLVNASVREALTNLGYSSLEIEKIIEEIEETDTINVSSLKEEHLSVFDCAVPIDEHGRYLSPISHLLMMAAIQPLITCAMSKTVNLPNSITYNEIADIYMKSWELGIKCVALYRDGCKLSQPLSTKEEKTEEEKIIKEIEVAKRRSLPNDIRASRHRFNLGGSKGYIILGEYPDGSLGEVFLKYGKNGSTMGGLIDGFTQLLSIALQYGVPLDRLIRSFINIKFEPSGFTDNKSVGFASSLYDYLFKYLDIKYFNGDVSGLAYRLNSDEPPSNLELNQEERPSLSPDGPPCTNCGGITFRTGACYTCRNCGVTSGCG